MMLSLFFSLFCMLSIAIIILSLPWIINHKKSFSSLFPWAFALIIAAVSLYSFSGDKVALTKWFSNGLPHYQLLKQFDELGGVDGAISQIKNKLVQHPDDAKGWLILYKLYLSKEDKQAARFAIEKAYKLQPHDAEIKRYYEM